MTEYLTATSIVPTYMVYLEEMQATSTGLLLWDDVCTGKTFIAGCIANAVPEERWNQVKERRKVIFMDHCQSLIQRLIEVTDRDSIGSFMTTRSAMCMNICRRGSG